MAPDWSTMRWFTVPGEKYEEVNRKIFSRYMQAKNGLWGRLELETAQLGIVLFRFKARGLDSEFKLRMENYLEGSLVPDPNLDIKFNYTDMPLPPPKYEFAGVVFNASSKDEYLKILGVMYHNHPCYIFRRNPSFSSEGGFILSSELDKLFEAK
jgi:hypothetical protein